MRALRRRSPRYALNGVLFGAYLTIRMYLYARAVDGRIAADRPAA